jgi:hypothetical protein
LKGCPALINSRLNFSPAAKFFVDIGFLGGSEFLFLIWISFG